MSAIRYPRGVSELLDAYDGFVIDLWGVMHSGGMAFPSALAALQGIKAAEKKVVILSNAPNRVAPVAARNAEQGIVGVDAILTSGEVAWQALKARGEDFYQQLGSRAFLIGPERVRPMTEGLDFEFVPTPEQADFFLLCGLLVDSPGDLDPAGYDDFLRPAVARGCPMICTNPDLVVVRGDSRETCAGAIAQHYEDLGGTVRWYGKPFAEVYHRCTELLGVTDLPRVLAVGDSLRTDVTGANRAGMDALFIAGGIHHDQIGDLDTMQGRHALEKLCAAYETWPVAALPFFRL